MTRRRTRHAQLPVFHPARFAASMKAAAIAMIRSTRLSLLADDFCTFRASSRRSVGFGQPRKPVPDAGCCDLLRATARSASPGQSRSDVRSPGGRRAVSSQDQAAVQAASIDGLPISGLA